MTPEMRAALLKLADKVHRGLISPDFVEGYLRHLAAEPLPTAGWQEPEVVAADPRRPMPACYTDPEWLARYHAELLKHGLDQRLTALPSDPPAEKDQ